MGAIVPFFSFLLIYSSSASAFSLRNLGSFCLFILFCHWLVWDHLYFYKWLSPIGGTIKQWYLFYSAASTSYSPFLVKVSALMMQIGCRFSSNLLFLLSLLCEYLVKIGEVASWIWKIAKKKLDYFIPSCYFPYPVILLYVRAFATYIWPYVYCLISSLLVALVITPSTLHNIPIIWKTIGIYFVELLFMLFTS